MGVRLVEGCHRAPDGLQFPAQIPLDFDHHRRIGGRDCLAGLAQSMKVTRLARTARPDFLTRTMDGIFGITDHRPDGEAQSLDRFQDLCADGGGSLIGQLLSVPGQSRTQLADDIEEIIRFLGLQGINA
jgi:hypothetical protein